MSEMPLMGQTSSSFGNNPDPAPQPRRTLGRPMKSESRLKKVFTDLSMSNEEKVLKRNYGQNFEVHLSQFPSPSRSLEASASGKASRPGTLHNQARAGARSVAARNLSAN